MTPLVRAEWLHSVVSRCQAFAGEIMVCEPEEFVREAERLTRELPAPTTIAERAALERLLVEATKALCRTAEYRHILTAGAGGLETLSDPASSNGRSEEERFIECARALATAAAQSEGDLAAHGITARAASAPPGEGHEPATAPRLDLREVARYIDAHCGDRLTARTLGRVFGCDGRRLARAFRNRFQSSLSEHVHRARILNGLRLLRRTAATVEAIALAVGFHSKATFYRGVVRATGQTPAQYRTRAVLRRSSGRA